MDKRLLILFPFFLFFQKATADVFAIYLDSGFETQMTDKLQAALIQEHEFTTDAKNLDLNWYLVDMLLKYKVSKSTWISAEYEQGFIRPVATPGLVERRPGIGFFKDLKLGDWKVNWRTMIIYRFFSFAPSFPSLRSRLLTTIVESKRANAYLSAEALYNYKNLDQIDQLRFTAGLRGELRKNLNWDLFFVHYQTKVSVDIGWNPLNVLGLGLVASF